jgi:membrane protein DedA with SNARE-associated domain
MVSIYVLIVAVIISLAVGGIFGHQAGYWYGRTLELYESAKRYGKLPEDMSFGEWLSDDRKAS